MCVAYLHMANLLWPSFSLFPADGDNVENVAWTFFPNRLKETQKSTVAILFKMMLALCQFMNFVCWQFSVQIADIPLSQKNKSSYATSAFCDIPKDWVRTIVSLFFFDEIVDVQSHCDEKPKVNSIFLDYEKKSNLSLLTVLKMTT